MQWRKIEVKIQFSSAVAYGFELLAKLRKKANAFALTVYQYRTFNVICWLSFGCLVFEVLAHFN